MTYLPPLAREECTFDRTLGRSFGEETKQSKAGEREETKKEVFMGIRNGDGVGSKTWSVRSEAMKCCEFDYSTSFWRRLACDSRWTANHRD